MPKIIGRREGSDSGKVESPAGETVKKTAERVYIIISDDVNQERDAILATSGLPQQGDSMLGGTVHSRDAKEVNTIIHPETHVMANLWEVTVQSDSTVPDGSPPGEGGGSSDIDTVKIRWATDKQDRRLERDVISGLPVQTKCGEPIMAERPISIPVLEIERYEPYPFDPNIILSFVNTACANSFWGAPAGSAFLDDIAVDEQEEGLFIYNNVKYRIAFNIPDGEPGSPTHPWQLSLLHQGTMHFPIKRNVSASGAPLPGYTKVAGPPVMAVDEQGNPITINLDAGGWPLDEGADPIWLDFARYRMISWAALNIDIDDVLGL